MVSRRWVIGWRRRVPAAFPLQLLEGGKVPTILQVEVMLLHLSSADHRHGERLEELCLVVAESSTPVPSDVAQSGKQVSVRQNVTRQKFVLVRLPLYNLLPSNGLETYPYVIESLYLQTRSVRAKVAHTARTARQFFNTDCDIE